MWLLVTPSSLLCPCVYYHISTIEKWIKTCRRITGSILYLSNYYFQIIIKKCHKVHVLCEEKRGRGRTATFSALEPWALAGSLQECDDRSSPFRSCASDGPRRRRAGLLVLCSSRKGCRLGVCATPGGGGPGEALSCVCLSSRQTLFPETCDGLIHCFAVFEEKSLS